MDIFVTVLESVLILLGIGLIGFWVTRRNILPENVQGFLSTLAIEIALPSTVFASVMINFNPDEYPDWWQLPLWWLAFSAIALILTLATRYVSCKETRPEFGMSLFYQNGIFLPLIILSGIFGVDTGYIPQLFIFIMFHPTMLFSTYQLFFGKPASGPTEPRWHRIINAVLVVTVIAVIIQLTNLDEYLPDFIVTIFDILGAMALPLVMLILGGSLYLNFHQKGKLYVAEIAKFIVIKNIVFPLAFIGVLALIRPAYNIALLFLLQAAVPPVTGVPILAERAGGNKAITTQFVFASFIACVLTIPGVFYLFDIIFPMP
jgi:predicted permease